MIRLIPGDCRTVLPTLDAGSVHTCVTSPPYYGLRSYLDASHPDKHREIGSKATPDEYLQTMVEVFREVRRVLRDDGTCWVNIGDSYASQGGGGESRMREIYADDPSRWKGVHSAAGNGQRSCRVTGGLAAKQLLMMPARLALALQADGWWLRSQIVWSKPNPMPESTRDRPTSAYEMVYLLAKASRYFYDADAVREEFSSAADHATRNVIYCAHGNGETSRGRGDGHNMLGKPETGRNLRNVWTIATQAFSESHYATMPTALVERCIRAGTSERGCCAQCGTPWVRELEKNLIPGPKACKTFIVDKRDADADRNDQGSNRAKDGHKAGWRRADNTTGWQPGCRCRVRCIECNGTGYSEPVPATYAPGHDCRVCNGDGWVIPPTVPCTVLDPFAGAGTTLLVADRLQRNAVGIELNAAYTEMAMERVKRDAPLFADLAPAQDPQPEPSPSDLFTWMDAAQ